MTDTPKLGPDQWERDAVAFAKKGDPNKARRVFADFIYVDGKVVPDTVGTLVYPADYAYDPKGNRS